MLGQLPTSLNIGNRDYVIRSDYRDVLQVIAAFSDDNLTNEEKVYVCMKRLYVDFDSIPKPLFREAYEAISAFIECHIRDERSSPKVINWIKDEQLIFPAINKVAGMEVRAVPYMHWWTFLGYFQSVDREDLWGFVLLIRQKKAKGKKLEKHEREFYQSNRELCQITVKEKIKSADDSLRELFNQLAEGGE